MSISSYLPYASLAVSVAAAILGVRAATVDIRDNIDEFMNDLKRQGKWASWAASMAALSVALQGVDQLLK